jgi:hypothetical protein
MRYSAVTGTARMRVGRRVFVLRDEKKKSLKEQSDLSPVARGWILSSGYVAML